MVEISALALSTPAHHVPQESARTLGRRVFAERAAAFDRMNAVYDNAGVKERQSCVPIDWYQTPHGWRERNDLYLHHALALLTDVSRRSLDSAGLTAASIDTLIVVSSTGVATPGLCARLMDRLPFRADVERLPIFGLGCAGGVLGCAGGVLGLARAAALARASPGSIVLLLVVELCGLTFRASDSSKSNIIASALFGDGACAAVIRHQEDSAGSHALARVEAFGEHRWPESLDIMGWTIEEDGFGVVFSRHIPTLVRQHLRPAADAFLQRHGVDCGDLAGLICHPGGAKVLEALAASFGLSEGDLAGEWAVLARHGNMSAPTVLFVLAEKIANGAHGRHLMTALGPGFTAGFLLLAL